MANIREYFDKAFEYVVTASRMVELRAVSGERFEIGVQVHFDFDAPARYISIFVPKIVSWRAACEQILTVIDFLLTPGGDVNVRIPPALSVFGGFHFLNGPPLEIQGRPLGESPIKGTDLPFSRTAFIYSDNEASPQDVATLQNFAASHQIRLRWRGPEFAKERSLIERPVAFISHDSRDKQEIARPLALRLQQILCPVWFDEFALQVGDSLRERIETGLKECPKCILILSHNFLSNGGWAKAEFDSIFTREILFKEDVILPVWCGVTAKEVFEYSPRLAGKVAVNWESGIDEVCRLLYLSVTRAATLPAPSLWTSSHGD